MFITKRQDIIVGIRNFDLGAFSYFLVRFLRLIQCFFDFIFSVFFGFSTRDGFTADNNSSDKAQVRIDISKKQSLQNVVQPVVG